MSTAEEFWREKLVSPEDVERLDKLYPLQVSPEEAVPPDEVRRTDNKSRPSSAREDRQNVARQELDGAAVFCDMLRSGETTQSPFLVLI